MMRKALLIGGLVFVGTIVAAPGAASDVSVPLSNLTSTFYATLKPAVIPADDPVPVSLHVGGNVRTGDGSLPPALTEVRVEGERHVKLDVSALPICRASDIPDIPPPWQQCRAAIVGHGHAKVVSTFPENTPMQIDLDLTVYNAGAREKGAKFLIYAYMPVIEPRPIIVPLKIEWVRKARYRWRAVATVPTIFEGHFTITHLDLTAQKRILSATCPKGIASLNTESTFDDGTVTRTTTLKDCH